MTTLLLAEHDNKSLKDATNKALTAVKPLGGDVHVLVAGKDCKAVADAAAKLDGVAKVLLADGAPYEHFLAEPLAARGLPIARGVADRPLDQWLSSRAISSMPLTVNGYIRPSISSLVMPIDRTCCHEARGVGLSHAALR